MNQILFLKEEGLGNSMNKIVRFFAVSIILFGLILLGKGGYSFAQGRKEDSTQIKTAEEAAAKKPKFEYKQNNSKLNLKVIGESEILKCSYKWNDEEEKELLDVSEQKSLEREIDIPTGTNELSVKVIYKNGKNFVYEDKQTFSMNTATIKFNVKGSTHIQVLVEDPKGIEYVTYKWNNQEENKKVQDAADDKKMELETAIPFGYNTLTITSVNKFGEKSEATQAVRGAEKPFIEANWSDDRSLLTIDVTCRDSIENVTFKVNGEEYKLDIANFIKQGYTIEDLNNVAGLTLEEDENGKIVHLKYEFPTQQVQGDLDLEIKSKAEYATETIAGSIQR